MARRSRRGDEREIRLSATQMRQPGMAELAEVRETIAISERSEASELGDEYRYVTADLKRIAIIAVVMLAVLVALALILP
jgi:NTP pyrophosphatase (non-canonical NTP hydrolase)